MNSIDKQLSDIASVHLGKAGDGTVVKPYVTPDTIDPSLIVPIPRELNRTKYGIDRNTVMFGYDVWHAYEFSTMLRNGYPISGTLKWVYNCLSKSIIESKSAKLYLNSYNMHRFDVDSFDHSSPGGTEVDDLFREHFFKQMKTDPRCALQLDMMAPEVYPFTRHFTRIEHIVHIPSLKFEVFNEDPNILVSVPGTRQAQLLTTNALRSNCRVTNQPDWGDLFVYINGSKHVLPDSLLQYVVSMRKENHFHEEIAECVYKRLYDLLSPDELLVACLYTRRGGIDICPVRATSYELLNVLATPLLSPTIRTAKTQRQ